MVGAFTASDNFTLHSLFSRRSVLTDKVPTHKRVMDVVLAGFIILVLAPVFALTAIAVALSSRGSVFFVQERVGYRGQKFGMIKFRSMYQDAEARRDALLSASDRQGICFKSKKDPRITPVGRFLRRTSLDELPQLFNVICGHMSLVGPRPALAAEVAQYPSHALERLKALPGITGIWQVSGRADIDFEQMVQMDVAYARHSSVWLDFAILVLTAGAVVSGRGAY